MRLLAAAALATLAACSTPSGAPLPAAPPPPPIADGPLVCAADVRLCPDGGYVSRSPDRDCAFDPCPAPRKP